MPVRTQQPVEKLRPTRIGPLSPTLRRHGAVFGGAEIHPDRLRSGSSIRAERPRFSLRSSSSTGCQGCELSRGSRRYLRRNFFTLATVAVMLPGAVWAVDRALVPLEDEGWALRLSEAIASVESGRLRQGVETFHEALTGLDRHHLIRVPAERAYELDELKALLKDAGYPVTAAVAASRPGRRFLPVCEVAHLALTLLREQVLPLYRSLYDGYVGELLSDYEVDGSSRHLETVAESYFFSSRGAWAAELLGDARFAAGLSRRAVGLWRRVLRVEPDASTRTRLRLKILRALHSLDDKEQYGIEKPRVLALARPGGELETLKRAVGELEQAVVPHREPAVFQSRWGGELPEQPPPLAFLKYKRSWLTPRWPVRGLPPMDPRHGRLFFGVRHLPFVPLADGRDMYMSWVFELFRIDGAPGFGRVEFEHRKPSSPRLRGLFTDMPAYVERSDSVLFTTTLWKKPAPGHAERHTFEPDFPERVLIAQYVSDRVLPSNYMQYDITVEIPIRSLVAYDRDRPKPLWKTGQPKQRPQRYSSAVQKDFSYTSPVIVKDGLVVAGGWVQRGFVDSLLRGHDLVTGELVWETFLSGDQNEGTMFGEMAREPYAGAILEDDNIVYYCTQFGAVAAVDLTDGDIRWLTTYDTIAVHATRSRTALKREAYWDANPLLRVGHV